MLVVEPGAAPQNQCAASARFRVRAKDAIVQTLFRAGRLTQARRRIAVSNGIVVLMLHRIVPDSELSVCRSPRGMVLRESLFAQLLGYLRDTTRLITPQHFDFSRPGGLNHQSQRPRVLLTFDDGWIDNVVIALPYLKQAKVRACFFVATDLAGQLRPFWPERALSLLTYARLHDAIPTVLRSLDELYALTPARSSLRAGELVDEAFLAWLKQFPPAILLPWLDTLSERLANPVGSLGARHSAEAHQDPMERLMTWNNLDTLVQAGHIVGSHTCSHAILPSLSSLACAQELMQSRRALEEHFSEQSHRGLWLSYPNGSFSNPVRQAVRDAGYTLAFSTNPGIATPQSDPLFLPRVNVWDGALTDRQGAFCEKRLDYSLFWRTSHGLSGL